MNDVVGLSSLNVDYIYEAEDLSFLEPFYPKGEKRRQWVLNNPEEIRENKKTSPGKGPSGFQNRGRQWGQYGLLFSQNGV